MKTILNLSLITLMVSCASQTKVSQIPGEWKVDDKKVSTGMPNYALSPQVFARSTEVKATRAPASVSDQDLADELEKQESKPSLRRLYFRALYGQWKELAQGAELKSCPAFHHDKVVMDEAGHKSTVMVSAVKPSAEHLPFYPEWALTVKHDDRFVPVWHTKGGKFLTEAFKHHEGKVRRELNEMCEEGTTDAYFRLENMVTYITMKPEFQSEVGLRALLKIPVFSTMLLVKSLQGTAQVQFTKHDEELLSEVKGFQLQRYIVELRKERQHLLTGSL